MSQDTSPQQGKRHWTGMSVALFILGLLILVPSGLCTAVLGGSIILEGCLTAIFPGFPSS